MKMPGFTAEVSLYNINDYYHAAIEANQVSGVVHPALLIAQPFRHSQWFCLYPTCIKLPLGNGKYVTYCYCW